MAPRRDSHDPAGDEGGEATPIGEVTHTGEVTRIFVAEDEFLIALFLEDELRAAGYSVVGPFTNLGSATCAARRERFDVALLDINLDGEMVYPLAEELVERKAPFIFLSGYGWQNTPEKFSQVPRVAKPFDTPILISEITRLVQKGGL